MMDERQLSWAVAAVFLLGIVYAAPVDAQSRRRRPRATPAAPAVPHSPMPSPPPDATTQRAREAYERGRALFLAGQFAEALVAFQQAYDAKPHPTVLLSVAECHDRLGDVRATVATLEQYLAAAPDARDRESVLAKVATLRRRPAVLHVTSTPSGALIEIDAAPTDRRTPADVELPPGDHVLGLSLEGHVSWTERVDVDFAERRDVDRTLERELPAGVELEVRAVGAGPRAPSRTAAWFALGVTGAALVTGGVFGALALSTRSEFDDAPSWRLADRGDRQALVADMAFGVAIAAGLTTIFAFAAGPRSGGDPGDTAQGEGAVDDAAPAPGGPEARLGGMGARVDF